MIRIPLPRTPRWLDKFIDWWNVDTGSRLWRYQPRRLDYLMIVMAVFATVVDGLYFHPWTYALVMDPLLFIFGVMAVVWFIKREY